MKLATLEFQFSFVHQANTLVASHNHDCHELVYYFDGDGYSQTGKKRLKYKKGSYSIYTSDTHHDEYHLSYTPVYCIGFKLQTLSNIQLKSGNYPDKNGYVKDLVEKIRKESFLHQHRYNDMYSLYLSDFLIFHERQYLEKDDKMDKFYEVKEYIHENLGNEISMDKLAKISGFSYHHFRHLFKEHTGYSPKQYITTQRMESAKILLDNSPTTILEIAQLCGYNYSSQFDIIFKKYTGMSPTQYRNQSK